MHRPGTKLFLAGLVSALLLVFGTTLAQPVATPVLTVPVKVEGGWIVGEVRGDVKTYFGIPYAAPPVGELRWKAPQSVQPWKGVRQTTEFSMACKQNADWLKEPKSEDCLYLNIWAPANEDKPLAVMVWIHGGGYYGGSGTQWGPDGGLGIVRYNVILVTLNYRLGIFGFFAHPELSAESPNHASGNQAIFDQIAALNWVKRNIAAFGGDPDRVTIVGELAGASSVALLTVAPLAKGLFQRAIAESGAIGPLANLKSAEGWGSDFAKAQGATHLADLRAMPADKLVKLQWSPQPNLDGYALPENPVEIFAAHRQNAVPLLLGWNADEGVDIAPEALGTKDFTAANYPALLKAAIGRDPPAELLKAYPGNSDAEVQSSIYRFTTDIIMGQPMYMWAARQMNTSKQPAYLYYFVHSPAEPKRPCGYGCKAGHGAEIRFAFDQLALEQRDWTAEDHELASRMVRHWTNFAKFGTPNGEGLPDWPAFDGRNETIERLGSEAEIKERGLVPDLKISTP